MLLCFSHLYVDCKNLYLHRTQLHASSPKPPLFTTSTPVLQVPWLPVKFRIKSKIPLYAFKAIKAMGLGICAGNHEVAGYSLICLSTWPPLHH